MTKRNKEDQGRGSAFKKIWPFSLALAIIAAAVFAIFFSVVKKNEKILCGGVAFHAAEEVAAAVDRLVDAAAALKSAIEVNPDLGKASAATLSSRILGLYPFVSGVSAAPSAIVKYHFPEAGNEALIGHDLLSNPERRDALVRSAALKSPVVSGPFEAVDGASVFFVRHPVFVGGKLWGFLSFTVDFEKFVETLAFEKRYPGFYFAFSESLDGGQKAEGDKAAERGKDQAGRFLTGRKEAFSETGAWQAAFLPGLSWRIYVMPSRGWTGIHPVFYFLFALSPALLVFAFAAFKDRAPRFKSKEGVRGGKASAFDAAARAASPSAAAVSAERGMTGRASPNDVKDAPGVGARDAADMSDAVGVDVAAGIDAAASARAVAADSPEGSPDGAPSGEPSGASPEEFLLSFPLRLSREVKFKGPEIKGQVYMPDTPLSMAFEKKKAASSKTSVSPRQNSLFTLEGEEADKGGLAILVVDDSEANRDIVGRMLALRGYKADFAASGEEAIALCATRKYTVIFLDCFMPGMDGYKTSSLLRAEYPRLKVSIVGMSAKLGSQEQDRCRLAGMNDLLVKPFTLKQLLAHVEKS